MKLTAGRRWLRFSLRTLLILMTIAAAILGWRVEKVRKMNAALAELARRGAAVSHHIGDDPHEYPLVQWPVWSFDGCIRVYFHGPDVRDDDFKLLEPLLYLNSLDVLVCPKITDEAFRHLERLETSLLNADIQHCNVSDRTVASLEKVPTIGLIQLRNTRITRSAAERLHHSHPDAVILWGDDKTEAIFGQENLPSTLVITGAGS